MIISAWVWFQIIVVGLLGAGLIVLVDYIVAMATIKQGEEI